MRYEYVYIDHGNKMVGLFTLKDLSVLKGLIHALELRWPEPMNVESGGWKLTPQIGENAQSGNNPTEGA